MVPLGQTALFQYVEEQLASSLQAWKIHTACLQQAQHTDKIDDIVKAYLQEHGFITSPIGREQHTLFAELLTGTPKTVLFALYDDPTATASGYYAFLFAIVTACKVYQAVIGPLPVNIKWLIGSSKVHTCASFQRLLVEQAECLRADYCLWYQSGQGWAGANGEWQLALGTKGLLRVACQLQTTRQALPVQYATIVPNAAWRLLWALRSLKDEHEEVLIEGFYDAIVPVADEELGSLAELPDPAAQLTKKWGMNELLLGLRGFQMHYVHLLMPTCTITSFSTERPQDRQTHESGIEQAVLPTQAQAQLDFHLVPDQDPQDIFVKLQQHLQRAQFADIQLHKLSEGLPARTPEADPFVQMVKRASSAAYGKDIPLLPIVAGHIPCAPLRHTLNIPVMIITTDPMAETEDQPGDEEEAQHMSKRIKQITMLLWELHQKQETDLRP